MLIASVLSVVCPLFVAVGPLGAATALATTTTLTFPYDGITGIEGGPEFWQVPPKVYYATFRVFGAQGGKSPGRPYVVGVGGRGGEATATLAVKPGELLEVNVGGMPGSGMVGRLLGVFSSGGFNGGGAGGGRPGFMGAGGGGASDVRRSPFALADRLLVAGGGGGAGGPGSGGSTFDPGPTGGGAGGGETGGAGSDAGSCGAAEGQLGLYYTAPAGGGGGGNSGGSAGASCGDYAQRGGQGEGGRGAGGQSERCYEQSSGPNGVTVYDESFTGGGGGGGGGGYYGGGGAGAGTDDWDQVNDFCYADGGAGGGGGSGFGPPGATFRSGARGGNGLVTVTYTPNCSHAAPCVRSVPSAPTNVEAAAGNHKATVVFATHRTSVPITFKVTASPGGKTVTSSSDPVIVRGLKNGTAYSFTVTATNELGSGTRSKRSNQVTPAPPPGAPTHVTAVALDHAAIVSFTAPRSRWSPIVGYKVIVESLGRELDAASPFIQSPAPPGGAVPVQPVTAVPRSFQPVPGSITVTGLTDGVTYIFSVTATNGIGTGPPSGSSNAVIPVGPPKAPTDVSASAGSAQATISFTRPYANGSPITGYTVTASPGGATATGKRSPITLTGLTNGTSYTFTVTATNAIGTSPASSPSNAITPLGAYGVTVRFAVEPPDSS